MIASLAATKHDVEEIVGRVVGEIVGDALQMISERFDQVDERFDRIESEMKDLSTVTIRIDNRLDDAIESNKDRDAQIRIIKRKIA